MSVVDYNDGSRVISGVPVYHQGNTSMCSQACITSLLNYLGYSLTYDDVISETSNQNMNSGMTSDRIMWYFRKYNLKSRAYSGRLIDIKKLIDKGYPVIVGLDERKGFHVVLVVGYNDDREVIFYNDSMDGEMMEEPYSDFLSAWGRKRANTFGVYSDPPNLMIEVTR